MAASMAALWLSLAPHAWAQGPADAEQAISDESRPLQRGTALSWVRLVGAEACITGPALARAVVERLDGAQVFALPAQADRVVEGRVERTQTGYRAVVVMTDAGGASLGERVVETKSPDCHALDAPLVLVLAAAVDAHVTQAAAQPERAPGSDATELDLSASLARVAEHAGEAHAQAPGPSEAPTVPGEKPASTPGTRPVQALGFGVRLSAGLLVGLLPQAAGAAGLGAFVEIPDVVVVGLEGQMAGKQSRTEGGARLDLRTWWLEGWVCQAPDRTAGLAPEVCAAVSIGQLSGEAFRVSEALPQEARLRTRRSWLVQVGPRLGLRYRLGHLAVWARLGLSLHLNRQEFTIRRSDGERVDLHRVEPVSFGSAAGIEWSF